MKWTLPLWKLICRQSIINLWINFYYNFLRGIRIIDKCHMYKKEYFLLYVWQISFYVSSRQEHRVKPHRRKWPCATWSRCRLHTYYLLYMSTFLRYMVLLPFFWFTRIPVTLHRTFLSSNPFLCHLIFMWVLNWPLLEYTHKINTISMRIVL